SCRTQLHNRTGRRPSRGRAQLRLTRLEERTAPAVFAVANTAAAGPGSLRQAVLDANAAPGADTITFDPAAFATPRTITLTTGELRVTDSVTIAGPGAALATVSGNNASRVFHMEGSGTLDVTLSGLTVTKGKTPAAAGNDLLAVAGGGIFFLGD